MTNSRMRFISKILCLSFVLIIALGVLCACNNDDNFRNERNGEPIAGEFYDLQTAYDNGWISKTDLRNIAYYFTGSAQTEGFTPAPKNPDTLSEEMELAIKESHAQELRDDNPEAVASDVRIHGYYGTYNGLVAVYIRFGGAWCANVEKNIGGIDFWFSDSHEILVWKAYDKDNDAIVPDETFYTPYAGKVEVFGSTAIHFPNYDDDFDNSCVLVTMNKDVSAVNKVYELSYFGNCQLESIEDLTYRTTNTNVSENFRQILQLNLINKSKQSVVDTLYELRTVSGVQWAEPNFYVSVT